MRLPRGSNVEAKAIEGVHLETLDHGIYIVLVQNENGIPLIIESRHIIFDECEFPGAPDLTECMEIEEDSDRPLKVDEPDDQSASSREFSIEIPLVSERTTNNDKRNLPAHVQSEGDEHDESEDNSNRRADDSAGVLEKTEGDENSDVENDVEDANDLTL